MCLLTHVKERCIISITLACEETNKADLRVAQLLSFPKHTRYAIYLV